MSCGKNYKGQHMDRNTYQHALDFCSEHGEYTVLGGGEPTIHPHFVEYLSKAIFNEQVENTGIHPWFATNGSKTDLTIKLMHSSDYTEEEFFEELSKFTNLLWEDTLFSMTLSQDTFHDPIDASVVKTAKLIDSVEIRDVSNNVSKSGHANHGEDRCPCTIMQIKPDGAIYMCGCDNSPLIGDVFNGLIGEIRTELGDEDFNENFEGCFNTPQTEEAEVLIEKVLVHRQTHKEWVATNIPIKKSKINHPETYRIPLHVKEFY